MERQNAKITGEERWKASVRHGLNRRAYIQRRWNVRKLARKGHIEIRDVQALDRLGRFSVAVSHWSLCDQVTRHALLNDAHPHVRSAAEISKRGRHV